MNCSLIFSEYFLELRRKVIHIVFGMVILMSYLDYLFINVKQLFVFYIIFLLVYILLVNKILIGSFLNSFSNFSKKLFERKSTDLPGIGGLMLLLGCYFPIVIGLNDEIVTVIIVTLSMGDGFATLVGKYLGKLAIPISSSRSVLGTLGGLVATLITVNIFIVDFNTHLILVCIVGIVIELFAGILPEKWNKFISIYSLDNILIPVGIIIFTTLSF